MDKECDEKVFIQCTNCKVFRESNRFIGKTIHKKITKRCLKCRDKDAKQKKRPDVIEKNKKRQNEKKYYIKSRINKRKEDLDAFLKRNAKNAKNWRDNNKEHLAKWCTKNFNHRFSGIKQQAQEKKILWNQDLTDNICYIMMTSKCFYCNYISDDTLNGLDRMNGKLGYELKNVVACCSKCNFIKHSLDPKTFINRCIHISKHFGGNGVFNADIWPDTNSSTYSRYCNRASDKKLDFSLTMEQFTDFQMNICYYCDKVASDTHTNGIDRIDNEKGYSMSNCVSCCSECNYMKGGLTKDEFIDTCKRVADYNLENNIEIPDIEKCEKSITKRVKHDVPKEKIVITKQQPNKEKIKAEPVEEYTPKKRVYTRGSNLPDNCSITAQDIPEFCYYVSVSKTKGDGFCCTKAHPKQKASGKEWNTTKSTKILIEEKYKQLMEYLES